MLLVTGMSFLFKPIVQQEVSIQCPNKCLNAITKTVCSLKEEKTRLIERNTILVASLN